MWFSKVFHFIKPKKKHFIYKYICYISAIFLRILLVYLVAFMWFCCWAHWCRFHLKTGQTFAVVYQLTLLLVCIHLENKPHLLQFHDVTRRNKHKCHANSAYQHHCLFVFAAFLAAILGWNANSFEHSLDSRVWPQLYTSWDQSRVLLCPERFLKHLFSSCLP